MMMIQNLFAVVAVMAGVLAMPVDRVHALDKRAVPRLGGVNLAGCEFGMTTEGGSGTYYCPSTDQITHFSSKGANLYRLPFGWQYMVGNSQSSTSLDQTFLNKYDTLVQAGLKAGAYVMLDLHNYARWNGGIVGQGGPSDDNLASVWKLLATKYKSESKVIFGVMNEPHDLDVTKWATTAQAAVNAIRSAGANSQMIALPGTFWQHPEAYTDGRNAPVMNVRDPAAADGSLLILDVHQYLDGDGSGQSRECTTNGVDKLSAVTSFLKANKRKAFLSETGGGNTASCQKALGEELKYVADNSDTWVGFAAWSAGSFDAGYELSITPVGGQDNDLFKKAVQPYLPGASSAAPVASSTSISRVSSAAQSSSTTRASTPASSSTIKVSSSTISSTIRSSSVPSSSSRAVTSSSARPVSSSSTRPSSSSSSAKSTSSARPVSSSSTRSSSSSSSLSPKPISSTSKASSSVNVTSSRASSAVATPSSSATAGNLQTFTGALGGFKAPVVTKSGSQFLTGTDKFNSLGNALERSCYTQMNTCQNAANQSGNKGDLTVGGCSNQVQACLKVAQAA